MNTATTPFFTVAIPLFNKVPYIARTLASVAAQTFTDYEVIVVDDGSTDGGADLVATLGDGIRLVRQTNGGPGLARNRAIDNAQGAWIAFLDADDLWRPDHLATLAGVIASCPEANVVGTDFERGDDLDGITGSTAAARYHDYFDDHRLICTSTVAVRVPLVRLERFGSAWPGEDVELLIRLALRHRFAVHPAQTAIYVQRTGGAMDSPTASTPIERQPVFATLDATIANPAFADRHAALAAFRNKLLIEYTRPALFQGQTRLARSYLRAIRTGGGRPPWLYRCLAGLPGPVAAAGSRWYGMVRRMLGRMPG